jgi:hypothetical protein
MTRRPRRKVKIKKTCSRCFRRLTTHELTAAMAILNDGVVGDTICADCMSPDELGRCAWLEAVTEAGLNIRDGKVLVRTRRFPESE